MTEARCPNCHSSFEKEIADEWNIKAARNLEISNEAKCPICLTSRTMKVWGVKK